MGKDQVYEHHISSSKLFVYLFYAVRIGAVKDFETRIEHLITYSAYRTHKKTNQPIQNYFAVKYTSEQMLNLQQSIINQFPNHLYYNQLKSKLEKIFSAQIK